MIHIMLGSSFEDAVCRLKGYVLSYEDPATAKYFRGIVCSEELDGTLIFKTAESFAATGGEALRFNSEPDDPFSVRLSNEVDFFSPEEQQSYLKNYFARLFDQTINLEDGEQFDQLNVTLYLPLHDGKYWNVAKRLVKAITEQSRDINVDLFFFASDMAYLFTPEPEQKDLPRRLIQYQVDSFKIIKEAVAFKEKSADARRLGHLVVMQNCNANGRALNLDWDSFVRIIGEYVIATVNSYNEVFSPNAEIEGRPIHAFGLSVLSLDKYYYIRYLLSRAYVTILEREGVHVVDVDVVEPSSRVQQLMTDDNGRYKVYDHIYDRRVKGYIATQGKTEEEISKQARRDIDQDVDAFVAAITSFINDENLSLPAKRVTLAQLLGMDDELMTGDMFNPDQLLFRDCYSDCIDMFVRANNALLSPKPSRLFVDIPDVHTPHEEEDGEEEETENKGDGEEKKKEDPFLYPAEFKEYAALSDEPVDFRQLIKDLKDFDVKIRRQTEYIRTLEKDLASCDVQAKQSEEKTKVLKEDGFHYGDKTFRLDPVEVIPLEKTYVPTKGKLPASVSLREGFTPVRDQGPLGSCTIFTMTGLFEYILKNTSVATEVDLSERFLYYNTRVAALTREGKTLDELSTSGTSFYDAIHSLSMDGICKEHLCPYVASEEESNTRPSDDAYAEARSRLVVEAKNVELKEEHIKSALNEGYPVAIAVHLFSDFGKDKTGFIPMPSEEEIEGFTGEDLHSNHAMIICGYSDENKVFVVRNSWGTDFGDHGYCYLPYSYMTDERIAMHACIITEVNTGRTESKGKKETVQFDRLNPEINAAIIRNLIGEAVCEKTNLIRRRTEVYTSYAIIEKKVVSPQIRSTLFTGTQKRLAWELEQIAKQKQENEDAEDVRMERLRKENIRTTLYGGIGLLGLVIVAIAYATSKMSKLLIASTFMFKVFSVALLLGVIAMGFWWYSYIKRRKAIRAEHAEINAELEEYEHERTNGDGTNLGIYQKALNIRMFMPWLVIRRLCEYQDRLTQKYQVMVAYTNNLHEWYLVEKEKVAKMSPETRTPFISLLSNEALDAFFDRHADEVTKGLRLSALFHQGFGLEDEAIVRFQNELKSRIIATLEDSLKDFTVYRYLTGESRFEFTRQMDETIDRMLTDLERKSAVYVRIGASANDFAAINSSTRLLMSCDIEDDLATWNEQFAQNFTSPPFHLRIPSPFKLSFLQMKRYPLAECIDLIEHNS